MQPNTPLTKMYAGSDLMLNGGVACVSGKGEQEKHWRFDDVE